MSEPMVRPLKASIYMATVATECDTDLWRLAGMGGDAEETLRRAIASWNDTAGCRVEGLEAGGVTELISHCRGLLILLDKRIQITKDSAMIGGIRESLDVLRPRPLQTRDLRRHFYRFDARTRRTRLGQHKPRDLNAVTHHVVKHATSL